MSEDRGWNASALTSGGRSALRRCAGLMMGEADAGAQIEFYRAMGGSGASNHPEYMFAALAMEMLWRETDHPVVKPMEEILRDMIRAGDKQAENEGLLSRVRAVLDTPWADDGFLLGKICNIVRIIRSANDRLRPDFWMLARDMRDWNREDRRVQRRWIRAIFVHAQSADGGEDQGRNNI